MVKVGAMAYVAVWFGVLIIPPYKSLRLAETYTMLCLYSYGMLN